MGIRQFINSFKKNKKVEKDASQLMTEERFWTIVEQSDHGHDIKKYLSALSEEELFGFIYWQEFFMHKSYKQDLWAEAYIALGGCDDDCFDYFRSWIITRGRDVFYNAVNDPDSLCDVFLALEDPKEKDYPENEEFHYAAQSVIEEREDNPDNVTKEYLFPEYDYNIEFKWEEDDEESIRRICPRTFEKMWNNNIFS